MIKRIVVDMDGIITDFVKGICNLHNRTNPYLDPKNYGLFDMDKLWGIPAEQYWNQCNRDFWRTLDWMPDGKQLIAFLEEIVGIDALCILTSPCKTEGCCDGKMDWIRDHLPAYERRIMIGPRKEFCASPDTLLIDDYDKNTIAFHEAGGQTFLVPRPWNSAHGRVSENWLLGLERMLLMKDSIGSIFQRGTP